MRSYGTKPQGSQAAANGPSPAVPQRHTPGRAAWTGCKAQEEPTLCLRFDNTNGLQGKPLHPLVVRGVGDQTLTQNGARNTRVPQRSREALWVQDLLRQRSPTKPGQTGQVRSGHVPRAKAEQVGPASMLPPGAPTQTNTESLLLRPSHTRLTRPEKVFVGQDLQTHTLKSLLTPGPLVSPRQLPRTFLIQPNPQLNQRVGLSPQRRSTPWPEQQEGVGWGQPTWLATACSLFLSSCFIFYRNENSAGYTQASRAGVPAAPLCWEQYSVSTARYREPSCSQLWAHLDGSVSLPEKVPTAVAAVHTAQRHEEAEREEVPVVIVAHTVVQPGWRGKD